nr:reverse transcriptase domain-containing protein [Tanacetum cinerariifolium]
MSAVRNTVGKDKRSTLQGPERRKFLKRKSQNTQSQKRHLREGEDTDVLTAHAKSPVSSQGSDVKGRGYHDTARKTERGRKASCSRGWEAKIGVRPHTPATISRAQGTRKAFPKVEIVKVGTRIPSLGSRCQGRRMTISLGHGCVQRLIRSRLRSETLIFQKFECPVTLKHMTRARIRKTTKKIQAAAKTERWAMPIWCHIFMHGITNPELIKWYHEKIPKTVDKMMRVATSFLRGEVAASNQGRKKSLSPWKQHEGGQKQNFKKGGGFRNQQRPERKQDRFTLLTKTPKEILALKRGKFKAPSPMTTDC